MNLKIVTHTNQLICEQCVATLPEEHAGGGQHHFVCMMRTVSHQDCAVTELALIPQRPQLLHQLAAVVWELHHCAQQPRRENVAF